MQESEKEIVLEVSQVYKDIDEVVRSSHEAGIGKSALFDPVRFDFFQNCDLNLSAFKKSKIHRVISIPL